MVFIPKASTCSLDTDGDAICDDGDGSGVAGDSSCAGGTVTGCDDNCPASINPLQANGDGDAAGDACECTDQNGDGLNTVSDLVAINAAIFNPAFVTPLCDRNNDGLCNVNDILAANVEIFSPYEHLDLCEATGSGALRGATPR